MLASIDACDLLLTLFDTREKFRALVLIAKGRQIFVFPYVHCTLH